MLRVLKRYDRYIAGSAVPTNIPLQLEYIDILKMPNFLYRREMGIINVGGNGAVIVEGTSNVLGFKDALYIGSGNVEVIFESYDTKTS